MEISSFLLAIIAVSIILILFGFPVAFALGVLAVIYLLANGFPLALAVQELAMNMNSFTLLAIPLFMCAGLIMNVGRITDRISILPTSLWVAFLVALGM